MKKLLMILIMIGIALGLSGVTYAVETIVIDSKLYAGSDYTSGFSKEFTPNTYIFSMFDSPGDDGWRDNASYTDNFQWSLYIYQPSTNTSELLGSHYLSNDINDAFSYNYPDSVTITVSNTESLRFWMLDTSVFPNKTPGFNNDGSVTFQVAVVPEPISSILFLTGGVVLAGRKYMKKRKA